MGKTRRRSGGKRRRRGGADHHPMGDTEKQSGLGDKLKMGDYEDMTVADKRLKSAKEALAEAEAQVMVKLLPTFRRAGQVHKTRQREYEKYAQTVPKSSAPNYSAYCQDDYDDMW